MAAARLLGVAPPLDRTKREADQRGEANMPAWPGYRMVPDDERSPGADLFFTRGALGHYLSNPTEATLEELVASHATRHGGF